jgi:hypothetical protein
MKSSCSANDGLITAAEHDPMQHEDAARSDLTDLVRVILLVQGAILLATTIEAFIFGLAFSAGVTPIVALTAASAVAVLVARARLARCGRRSRMVLRVIEALLLITIAVEGVLALVLARTGVPPVALLTRFAIPVAVLALLSRTESARVATTSASAMSSQNERPALREVA